MLNAMEIVTIFFISYVFGYHKKEWHYLTVILPVNDWFLAFTI
jgi:hypothetical protein